MNKSFVIANLKFYQTKEGGLCKSFDRYVNDPDGQNLTIGFPMNLDGQYFDFRIYYLPSNVILGNIQKVMLKFLSPHIVIPRLKVGCKYRFLYNGRDIGEFTVLEIHNYEGVNLIHENDGYNLWMARGIRCPNFYLVSKFIGIPVACFLQFHTNPKGSDCLCGVNIDPSLASITGENGTSCRYGELVLYCFKDVFDASSPCEVMVMRVGKLANGDPALEFCDTGVLCRSWEDVTQRIEAKCLGANREVVGIGGILQRAKVLFAAISK